MSKAYWWFCYGKFEPGKDGLPVFWQVISYYRELRGMSKKDLADALNYTVMNPCMQGRGLQRGEQPALLARNMTRLSPQGLRYGRN